MQARHLAEFIMIEPEMAWCDLAGKCLLGVMRAVSKLTATGVLSPVVLRRRHAGGRGLCALLLSICLGSLQVRAIWLPDTHWLCSSASQLRHSWPEHADLTVPSCWKSRSPVCLLQYSVRISAFHACRPDLDFINLRIDKTARARLHEVATKPFKRLSYTDAIEALVGAVAKGHKFEFPVRRPHASVFMTMMVIICHL